jgi:hypothetical protein
MDLANILELILHCHLFANNNIAGAERVLYGPIAMMDMHGRISGFRPVLSLGSLPGLLTEFNAGSGVGQACLYPVHNFSTAAAVSSCRKAACIPGPD